jgi:hypothetical protein
MNTANSYTRIEKTRWVKYPYVSMSMGCIHVHKVFTHRLHLVLIYIENKTKTDSKEKYLTKLFEKVEALLESNFAGLMLKGD